MHWISQQCFFFFNYIDFPKGGVTKVCFSCSTSNEKPQQHLICLLLIVSHRKCIICESHILLLLQLSCFLLYVHSPFSLYIYIQLGGWAVSGQWNQTDFNSTLSLLMRDYATFPFFNLYVGKDPNEVTHGSTKRYIQASINQEHLDVLKTLPW